MRINSVANGGGNVQAFAGIRDSGGSSIFGVQTQLANDENPREEVVGDFSTHSNFVTVPSGGATFTIFGRYATPQDIPDSEIATHTAVATWHAVASNNQGITYI